MSIMNTSRSAQALATLALIAVCVLCLQALCSCASKSGDEGAIDQAIKYASSRNMLDMSVSCVVRKTPDARVDISLLSLENTPDSVREIELEPAVISDTMASWTADEWAENRYDLFFNFVAHFNVICKQANDLGDIPEAYVVTCPEYMVVYDSRKDAGYVVTSTGVYQKTDDPENPIGEAVILAGQD